MVIKLRQGAGRLIRSETDTGVIAILDSRAAKGNRHRNRVLKALNKYPLVNTIDEKTATVVMNCPNLCGQYKNRLYGSLN